MHHIQVAIDGPSGSGKSTLAKALAKKFGLVYVDTGALYRTVGLAVKNRNISAGDSDGICGVLPHISVSLA